MQLVQVVVGKNWTIFPQVGMKFETKKTLHPSNLPRNLKIPQLKRKFIFRSSIFGFHVHFPGWRCWTFCLSSVVSGLIIQHGLFQISVSILRGFPPISTNGNHRQPNVQSVCQGEEWWEEKSPLRKFHHASSQCWKHSKVAKWNLISCSKNKKMVHLVYHPHFAAKKSSSSSEFVSVCSSEPWDSHHTKTRNKTTPETLKACNFFFSDHGTKKRGSKHRGLVANINWKVIAWNNRWNIVIIAGTYFDPFPGW